MDVCVKPDLQIHICRKGSLFSIVWPLQITLSLARDFMCRYYYSYASLLMFVFRFMFPHTRMTFLGAPTPVLWTKFQLYEALIPMKRWAPWAGEWSERLAIIFSSWSAQFLIYCVVVKKQGRNILSIRRQISRRISSRCLASTHSALNVLNYDEIYGMRQPGHASWAVLPLSVHHSLAVSLWLDILSVNLFCQLQQPLGFELWTEIWFDIVLKARTGSTCEKWQIIPTPVMPRLSEIMQVNGTPSLCTIQLVRICFHIFTQCSCLLTDTD